MTIVKSTLSYQTEDDRPQDPDYVPDSSNGDWSNEFPLNGAKGKVYSKINGRYHILDSSI